MKNTQNLSTEEQGSDVDVREKLVQSHADVMKMASDIENVYSFLRNYADFISKRIKETDSKGEIHDESEV